MEELANLPAEELENLRQKFLSHGDEGLNLEQFVKIILETLGHSRNNAGPDLSTADDRELVSSMCETFEEIDRNGNGNVEWAELTSFWVDKGFVATRRLVEPLRFRFREDMQYKDRYSRGSKINKLVFLDTIQKIASFEKESMKLKIYDTQLRLCGEADVGHAIHKYRPSYRRKDELRDCLVVPRRNILIILSSDLSLTFWDANNLRFNHFAFAKSPQTCIAYSPETNKVYTAGSSNRIHVWFPEKGQRTESIVTRHKEAITDILVVGSLVVTCSLDKTIQTHDITTGRHRATLRGHKLSIKHMVYSKRQGTLLSAGLETDVLGWDLVSQKLVVRLSGHRTSVIGVHLLPNNDPTKTDRAITADNMGNFRIWDFQRSHTGQAVCLQVFQRKIRNFHGKSKDRGARDGQKPLLPGQQRWTLDDFHPNTFCVTNPGADIIAATSKMCRFTSSGHKNMNNMPSGAIFNSVSLTFITAMGKDVQLWDGRTGQVEQDMFSLAKTELTSLLLDDRERKFIVGHAAGHVLVHSYLNGVKMKKTEISHAADVTGIAYVGAEKLIISVARDRSIMVHDEWPEDECAPFLRGISCAHHADITCVAYSEPFSLIASGSADATVTLWNFEFLKAETLLYGHSADIVAVSFVGSFPILVSADANGIVLVSLIHPSSAKGRCLQRFENWNDIEKFGSGYYYDGKPESKCQRTAITALAVHEEISTGRWLLVLGDEMGVVKTLDLSVLIQEHGLQKRDPETYPLHRTGYNARRRLRRDSGFVMDKQVQMQQEHARSEVAAASSAPEKLPLLAAIKAHHGAINSIQVIDAPLSVLTSSLDRSVRIHNILSGELLGILNMSDEEKEAISTGETPAQPWLFDVEPTERRLEGHRHKKAAVVLEQIEAMRHAEIARSLAADAYDLRQRKIARARARLSINQAQELELDIQQGKTASCLSFDQDPQENAMAKKRADKDKLLEQLLTKDAQASGGVRATPSTYTRFAQEQQRNKLQSRIPKKANIEASSFLRKELGFGSNTRLRDRKQRKLDSLSHFRRKFATKGLLEDKLTMSSWLNPAVVEAEADEVQRPSTAPEQTPQPLDIAQLWGRSNANFVDAIDNMLVLGQPSPRQLSPLNQESGPASPERRRRPSTAGNNAALDAPSASDQTWRRRSTAVRQRFELAAAADVDLQRPRTSPASGISSRSLFSQESSVTTPSHALHPPDTGSSSPSATQHNRRRRRSLIQRQADFAQVSEESKLRRMSSSLRMESRRSLPGCSPGGVRFGPYHESHVRGFYDLFKELDPDQSGFIDMQEFYTNVKLRESPIAASLGSIFETMDEDDNATVDLVEFLQCFLPLVQHSEIVAMVRYFERSAEKKASSFKQARKVTQLSEEAEREIDELFNQLDENNDNSIQLSELRHVALANNFIKEEDVREIAQRYSSLEDASLSKEDFKELCSEYFSYNSDKLIREVLSFNQKNKKRDGLRARLSTVESTTLSPPETEDDCE
ncbi:WD repeat-containing protein 5-like [Hondaea fermentalgiana]|uniref:WD repeat-containing protein 5-like n=1 Tax=Hondaea fermentalgiana TaxID=2315210 RepID=A0A2R5GHJ6_9STRA|nr:WD repeat-containing protein 5-like [Hondaea fermentalgiana]|eukprot:GBG30360.1 WD repeat-containing protein 5-like [Hondaea fermentalgiana]